MTESERVKTRKVKERPFETSAIFTETPVELSSKIVRRMF